MGKLAIQTLAQIQLELKAPKGQYNSFGKYKYRNCEDILEALKPICHKYNSAILLSDKVTTIADRFYIEATATLFCYSDTETDTISVTAYAREENEKKGMDASQVTGASSSYARKYALNGLFGIDDTKDSDSTNTGENKPNKPQAEQQPTQPKNEPKTSQNEPTNASVIQMTYEQALNYTVDCKLHFGKALRDVYKTDRASINDIYKMGTAKLKRAIEIIESEIAKAKK